MTSIAGAVDGPDRRVADALAAARFVDHHVHAVVRERPDRRSYLAGLTESDRPAAVAGLDTQLGIATRRWIAPLLGLPPSASGEAFLERRLALSAEEAAALLLPEAGIATLIVDNGFRPETLVDLATFGRLARARAVAVARLELLAEELVLGGVSAAGYPAAYREALARALPGSVGFKTVLAYRGGFDLDLVAPSDAEVVAAAGRWLTEVEATGRARLTDRTLLAFGIWEAVRTGRPIQFHTGFGDSDLQMSRVDPSLLTPFLRATEGLTQVLLLHTYPYHRTAGYLAQMFGHVSVDVGLAVHHTGIASERIIAESLELAPIDRVLFSSDGWGLPELHVLGSWLFRRGLSRTLGRWVADGDWSLPDALMAIERIGRTNARRIYALDEGVETS